MILSVPLSHIQYTPSNIYSPAKNDFLVAYILFCMKFLQFCSKQYLCVLTEFDLKWYFCLNCKQTVLLISILSDYCLLVIKLYFFCIFISYPIILPKSLLILVEKCSRISQIFLPHSISNLKLLLLLLFQHLH